MSLLTVYRSAQEEEGLTRARRLLALRALLADGMSQRALAAELGISQPAISQQATTPLALDAETLIKAAAPLLKVLAQERGFTDLAVFGSVARGQSRPDSDIDLLVQPPPGATISDLLDLQELFERILHRSVDLVSHGGLRIELDSDVMRDAVRL